MKQPKVLLWAVDRSGLYNSIVRMLSNRFTLHQFDDALPETNEIAAAIVVDQDGKAIDQWRDFLLKVNNNAPVLLIGSLPECGDFRDLLRSGMSDFVVPPFSTSELCARLERLTGYESVEKITANNLTQRLGLSKLIGNSHAFRSMVDKIPLIAKSGATVLLEGETGTGKEVCARAIHYVSHRSKMPFVTLNCAAIPPHLLENELFGHEPEAYTGASSSRRGLIDEADGGTLLLDEIDSLPAIAQVKLLRLLQEKEFRALGSTKTRSANIRIIGATNCNMAQAVRDGKIREDFFYRLNVLSLKLPPLRERDSDILILSEHFIGTFAKRLRVPCPTLSTDAIHRLLGHQWPGNVRELEHVIERAVVMVDGGFTVCSEHIVLPFQNDMVEYSFQKAKARAVSTWERRYIETLLKVHGGNISSAARSAKKNRRAFWELVRKHSIDTDQFRAKGS